jgi:hypothetical protein
LGRTSQLQGQAVAWPAQRENIPYHLVFRRARPVLLPRTSQTQPQAFARSAPLGRTHPWMGLPNASPVWQGNIHPCLQPSSTIRRACLAGPESIPRLLRAPSAAPARLVRDPTVLLGVRSALPVCQDTIHHRREGFRRAPRVLLAPIQATQQLPSASSAHLGLVQRSPWPARNACSARREHTPARRD